MRIRRYFFEITIGSVIALMAAAITFPGGYMPYSVDVGNGETAIAYRSGIVYVQDKDCGSMFNKCTLWRNAKGTVMQSFDVLLPTGTAALGRAAFDIPATPRLADKWQRAQLELGKRI